LENNQLRKEDALTKKRYYYFQEDIPNIDNYRRKVQDLKQTQGRKPKARYDTIKEGNAKKPFAKRLKVSQERNWKKKKKLFIKEISKANDDSNKHDFSYADGYRTIKERGC